MAKEIKKIVKLEIKAGEANPAPPVGPSLAPFGINIGQFCAAFNEKTQDKKGWILPVEITIYEDNTFEFRIKEPPTAELLKKITGIEKGSGKPLERKVGKITRQQLREVAERKLPDLNTDDIEKAIKIVEGTAKTMGLEIE
jgi:large subunit ribosomal protein L11